MISAILACDHFGGISKQGIIPWPKNKVDMYRFIHVTKYKTVIMGRGTWEATDMPSPLPHRKNIVVTRNSKYVATGATDIICNNVKESVYNLSLTEDVVIIGGAALIKDLWDIVDILHLTVIAGKYECDTYISLDTITNKFNIIEDTQVNEITVFKTYLNKGLYGPILNCT